MKTLIVTFSGTGNTEKVAKEYETALIERGAEVTLCSLPLKEEIDYSAYDLIGIGYPIHSFNAPANVLKFAKSLPKTAEKKRAFVFKTSGEPVRMSDVSSLKLIKILKKRGYIITNEYQYVMPYNMIFRHSDEMAYKMWDTAKRLVPADCTELLAGTPRKVRRMFMGGFLAWVMRIEHWGARLNGRFYKAQKSCIKCGKCVKICPEGNIKFNKKGKIKFGKKCLMCVRCSFYCPVNAINIGFVNGWKVNGAYSFAPPAEGAEPKKDKHANYCAKAYKRYFENAEKRINGS